MKTSQPMNAGCRRGYLALAITLAAGLFAGACSSPVTVTDQQQLLSRKDKSAARTEEKRRMQCAEQSTDARPAAMAKGEMARDDGTTPRFNTEEYDHFNENEFKLVKENPLSTFSIDVDTASYTNLRRFITSSQLPPKDAVRIEEMINYFDYVYPQPAGEHPFSVNTEIARCPWNRENRLVHIGIQGKSIDYANLKPCNLVFLVDTSGSMNDSNKLPLLVQSLKLLVGELSARDRVAIVAYAGSAGQVLPSTPASRKDLIIGSLERLQAGGTTAGGEGIVLAYAIAKKNLIEGGNNRVVLCTDGDFNIGVSSTGDLVRMIEEKRKDDIYLTICGFGMGNYKDTRMMKIADAGNGNYYYIDGIREARKVFVKDMRGTMFTIAKDVKIQVEFNPARVKGYRLVGYEKRILAREDFNDDTKDAGELGAGHRVTALYEIIPAGSTHDVRGSDDLRYQQTVVRPDSKAGEELMTVKLRYKQPRQDKSRLITMPVADRTIDIARTSDNFRLSSAVAGFGMLLRESKFAGSLSFKDVAVLARGARGADESGYRAEFINLVESCAMLKK